MGGQLQIWSIFCEDIMALTDALRCLGMLGGPRRRNHLTLTRVSNIHLTASLTPHQYGLVPPDFDSSSYIPRSASQ